MDIKQAIGLVNGGEIQEALDGLLGKEKILKELDERLFDDAGDLLTLPQDTVVKWIGYFVTQGLKSSSLASNITVDVSTARSGKMTVALIDRQNPDNMIAAEFTVTRFG